MDPLSDGTFETNLVGDKFRVGEKCLVGETCRVGERCLIFKCTCGDNTTQLVVVSY